MTALRRFFFLAVGLFLALPLIVVAGVSINEKQTLAFPPQGFSLSWYGEIFANDEWRSALFASLTLAATSAALALLVALPLAWFLWRRVAPWANIFQLLGVAPFTPAARHNRTRSPDLLGNQRVLRPAVDRRHQPRNLLRDSAARHAVARLFGDRPVPRRGRRDHGSRRPGDLPHGHFPR
jgi:hypothetical protein